jgi:hypothetical protein
LGVAGVTLSIANTRCAARSSDVLVLARRLQDWEIYVYLVWIATEYMVMDLLRYI